ncbi:MAG TPA: DUF2344 domain-containing protein [Holophagaceae bacterium]
MSSAGRPPAIPPEVLAREARLSSVLVAMARAGSREARPLQALRAAAAAGDGAVADALVDDLLREGLAEEALAVLREIRRPGGGTDPLEAVRKRLVPPAGKAQSRRAATWQLDSRRVAVRIAYEKLPPATDFDTGDLHRILLAAFRLEGLRPALDLGQHPRPLLLMGPPLPAGAGGREEWAEAVFQRSPDREAEVLLAELNARLPEGLRLHRWIEQPGYATPVAELAEASEWSWPCPAELQGEARSATARFLAAASFPWDRAGKVGGQKQEKHVDLRPMVSDMAWEGSLLRFRTPMAAFGATNPLKLLGAVLGVDPASLSGVVREGFSLREDPRLAQGERFEPKLRNIYEDAVLLSGGSNITLVDDEDDEPLHLG